MGMGTITLYILGFLIMFAIAYALAVLLEDIVGK
jgi:uncharacterized membrane protein